MLVHAHVLRAKRWRLEASAATLLQTALLIVGLLAALSLLTRFTNTEPPADVNRGMLSQTTSTSILPTLTLIPFTATPTTSSTPTRTSTSTRTPTPTPDPCAPAWSVVPSPSIGQGLDVLRSVSVISPLDIWAVGYYEPNYGRTRTLVEHWDGTSWTVIPSPNLGTDLNELHSVSAVSPVDVWAVGYYYHGDFRPVQTLIIHWDGTQWSVVSSPNLASGHNRLFAVDAVSYNDVWAVGYYESNSEGLALLLRWDGTQWSTVPSPNPAGIERLSGISARSADDIWAVGVRFADNVGSTLILHWDGVTWSIAPVSTEGHLSSVASISSNDAWAVGYWYDFFKGRPYSLTMHWNGSAWSVVPSPDEGWYGELRGVTAIASNDVWAVGFRGSTYETWTKHWNGSSWSNVPGANPPPSNKLYGVAHTSAGDVWAVGETINYSRDTLIERYGNPCIPFITPTTTPTQPPTRTATVTTTPPISTPTVGGFTATSTRTGIAQSPTITPMEPTNTPRQSTPTSVATACPFQFVDVDVSNTFYPFIRCLACRGIVGGYSDGTFRPGNEVTRGQLSKIVANAAQFNEPVSGQTFIDVPSSHTFYEYIERMARRGIIGGYSDGTFRPNNNATRGQIAKIVANAARFNEPVSGQTFVDVPTDHTFYEHIERIATRGIISGYSDGTFRPNNNATRGQTSKIVANSFFPNCQTL